MNKKQAIFQLSFGLLLLVVIEGVCWMLLKREGQQVDFLISLHYGRVVNATKEQGFNEIDPLCGWALSNQSIKKKGFEVEQNCVVLRSEGITPSKPLRILITGGSTSDIVMQRENWPMKLHEQFKRDSINTIIYVAAVAGYSSGQEMLKLLRDGINLNPDIHISYSGANDGDDGGYVSDYEKDFYATAYQQSMTSALLPNTVFLIKKTFNLGYNDLAIKKTVPMDAYQFWKRNMHAMGGIAHKNGYKFIGILQPILGGGNYHDQNQENEYEWRVKMYEQYFSKARAYIPSDTSLHDFTHIFDTATAKVYADDCHLTKPYQTVVANQVYQMLLSGGCITR